VFVYTTSHDSVGWPGAVIVVVAVSLVCGDGPLTGIGPESNSKPPEQLLVLNSWNWRLPWSLDSCAVGDHPWMRR